ncbi:hypothetical protein [Desulfovibrio inopinatus]|uniref:hypothetical protein n=1 Tax=Desulfovibrio inopinatus TaxID=102109 RepID=UPI0003F62AE9|nr:hypothetical protein [Desulfovibrio inopinatus]
MSTSQKENFTPGPNTVVMKAAADARNIVNFYKKYKKDRRTWLHFEINQKQYCYANGMLLEAGVDKWGRIGLNINHEASVLVGDKFGTKTHLKERGFSVPRGLFFRRRHIDEAINAFDSFRKPICVKPNKGAEGRGVFPSIYEQQWYEYALRQVAETEPNILVEESVTGDHFRFFYIKPQIVGIRQGVPLHVIGNGVSSIKDLFAAKNAKRRERNLPFHPPYKMNQRIIDFLAMQNLTLDDILPLEQRIFLLGTSNGGKSGADTILLDKEEVHSSYCKIIEQACQSVPGLYVSGVDLIIQDIKQPAQKENHWILEMNTSPAVTGFYYPWEGKVVDVAGLILDYLAEQHVFS